MANSPQAPVCLTSPELEQLALGLLDDSKLESAREHLQQCQECLGRLREMAIKDSMTSALNAVPNVQGRLQELQAPIRKLLANLSLEETHNRLSANSATEGADKSFADLPRTALIRGSLLGNYEIADRLGQGGMGTVYKARHRRMDRVVAIKVLSARFATDAEVVSRFHREVKAIAQINHPHVVAAYDADEAGGVHFLAMEYVDGTDLLTLVRKSGPLRIKQAVNCAIHAARGLACAHERGIVHRDIKPANLILDRSGVVKVLDLGLARLGGPGQRIEDDLTQPGTLMGTMHFMAPEQALDAQHADARADIYSLGCTLYFLLAGRTVFEGDTPMKTLVAHREQPVPKLRTLRSDVPVTLEAIITRMLAKKPDDRFSSMQKVIAALRPFAISRSVTPDRVQPAPVPKRGGVVRSRRWGLMLTGAAACLLFASLVLKFKSAEGTLILNIEPADADVQITSSDGRVEITRHGEPGVLITPVDHGRHRLQVEKAGFRIFTEDFSIDWGGKATITAKLVPLTPTQSQPAVIGEKNTQAPTPKDRNHRTAEWVLRVGGKLKVTVNGEAERDIATIADLPAKDYSITYVVVGPSQTITDSEMQNLDGLQELRFLQLHELFKLSDNGTNRIHGLKNLEVAVLDVPTDAGIAHILAESSKLRRLFLRTVFSGTCLKSLQAPSELQELELYHSRVMAGGLANVDRLINLTSLTIDATQTTPADFTRLGNLRKLKYLGVRYRPDTLIPFDDASFKSLTNLTGLHKLELSSEFGKASSVGHIKLTDSGVENIKALKHLNYFDVTAPLLTDTGLKHLSEIEGLRTLRLSNSPRITDGGLKHLTKIKGLARIEFLRDAPLVSDAGLKHLAALPDLEFVHFFSPQITDEGLGHLRDLEKLGEITLPFARISETGLDQLASSRTPPVAVLTLPYTEVTDAGASHLLRMPRLMQLDLAGTRISDIGMQHLAKMAGLRLLDLRGTAVTEGAVSKLRASLPDCKIWWSPRSSEHWAAMWAVRSGGAAQVLRVSTQQQFDLKTPFQFDTSFGGGAGAGFDRGKIFDVPDLFVLGLDLRGRATVTDLELQHLKGLSRIDALDLSETKLTGAGLGHLSALKTLRKLELNGTHLTDGDLSTLATLSNLRLLSLKKTQVTEAGISSLKELLPKCEIVR